MSKPRKEERISNIELEALEIYNSTSEDTMLEILAGLCSKYDIDFENFDDFVQLSNPLKALIEKEAKENKLLIDNNLNTGLDII